ncbi:hypothetical protein R1flu_020377 [Riccia fluitans]|uniref:Uncharacterized protein n=1 Tax=Riccia fluitans TaxID=41844 RepID=A0ABD1ZQ41_9MARC
MLLESALADFSQEASLSRGHPSAMPFVWDDRSGNNPYARSGSYNERISMLSVKENEGLHLHEEAADMFNARKNQKEGVHHRSDSGQFYHKQGTVPFKWEAAPGKPAVAQETITTCESPRLRLPPALRSGSVPMGCNGPRNGGIAGKMKSILSGKGSKSGGSNAHSNLVAVASSRSSSSQGTERDQWSSSSDRESSFDSDGGVDDRESSPVSTLDRPASPLSPLSPKPESPKHETIAIIPVAEAAAASTSTVAARAPNYAGQGMKNLSRNGSWKHLVASLSAKQQTLAQTSNSFLSLTEMSEELPMILEDEEDSEFHTMEFSSVDSPGTIEERRERSLRRRPSSSKSLSAPLPHGHRQSSLGNANRQRRRSDFDWPDEFQDGRPEEVVKEVDESLWAFSPVSSTFVFSANDLDNSACFSGRSPVRGERSKAGTGTSTPASTGSGSIRETLSIRKTISLMRSASTRSGYNGKSSAEAAAVHAELASQNSRQKSHDDDEVYNRRGHRMKRTLSCIPFLNLGNMPTVNCNNR